MDYSVIIPVYASDKSLNQLVDELVKELSNITVKFEIICVWDFGNNESKNAIYEISKKWNKYVTPIHLTRNFGQHNATLAGISISKGEFVITMDEDGQHSPRDIEKLIEKQQISNAKVVYGKYDQRNHSLFRNITSVLLSKLISIGIPDLHKNYSSFRLINGLVARSIVKFTNSYTFLDGYLSWVTNEFESTVVKHSVRKEGESSYSFVKLFNHFINIFVTFSNLPIKVVNCLSLLFIGFSVSYSFYCLALVLFFKNVLPGYTSIVLLLSFGIGFILFSLSVLGRYLIQINEKTTSRPHFIIDTND
jgi:glycosyltransferase involved in cell wall biosynthesis